MSPDKGHRPMGRLSSGKPVWLRMRRQGGQDYNEVKRLLRESDLHTVCESANCPNRGECFGARTATFLLMGEVCTRHCTFCNIAGGIPGPLDAGEPRRIAAAVQKLGLKFAVLTSVTRDDLPDGGASHFAATIGEIRQLNSACGIEVLIPDFQGEAAPLDVVLAAEPTVLNHNLETVPRLYATLRPQADYRRSLNLLRRAGSAAGNQVVKTGIMVGAGETRDEVIALLEEAAGSGVQTLTMGQYLQPTRKHHPVDRFVTPDEFAELAEIGRELGIDWVEAGPLVRSSYHARELSALCGGPDRG